MKKILTYTALPFLLLACSKTPPQPIVLPQPVVHHEPLQITSSGQISRDLFRSFWVLPSKDQDMIHLGIIPSAKTISFSSTFDFRIRVHEEHKHWDIFSPAGVLWEIQQSQVLRPQLVRYFATIDYHMTQPGEHIQNNLLLPWIKRGFKQAQWIGPPKMDAKNQKHQLTRYFLSVSDFQDEKTAKAFCRKFNRQYGKKCSVIGRVELPLLGAGKLVAKNSNFEKSFKGILELITEERQYIHVHNVPIKLLSNDKKSLPIHDQLFILPNTKEEFSVVEALPLKNYLEGVLPSEIYPTAPIEALKSQAIIARTYTLSQLWSRYSLEPFYTCVTTQCQAYHGKKKIYPQVRKAVVQTKDQVLKTKADNFAKTFYHSSSGGKTDDANIIFTHSKYVKLSKKGAGYKGNTNDFIKQKMIDLQDEQTVRNVIKNKEQTYCNITRYTKNSDTWHRSFSAKQLLSIFGSAVTNLSVLQRGFSGRITALEITTKRNTKTITNELSIRKTFGGLPSSLMVFDIIKNSDGTINKLEILGRGRGHGVGLSQLGAIGRAQHHQNYQQILRAYYPKTNLTTILTHPSPAHHHR